MADGPAPTSSLRVRLDGPARLHAKAEWALEALLARAGVSDWERVGDGIDADLAWGHAGSAPHVVPVDPDEWEFAWDREPDASRDPLAATFWWLARVEELLAPDDAFDEHGRFRYDASAMSRQSTKVAAPVDELAQQLAGEVSKAVLPPASEGPTWRIVATHDIDLPVRWTRSGRRRALRTVRRDLQRLRIGAAARTFASLVVGFVPGMRDPWDNFDRIQQLEAREGARSTSYLLAGRMAPEDGDAELHERGRGWAGRPSADVVGVHGSYVTSEQPDQLRAEQREVAQRTGAPASDHRFHYLRHRPVDAWPMLDRLGFTSDASLGFAEQPGFRAGTARPFRAWDHTADAPLGLVVIPLVLMDASFDERYMDIRSRVERRTVVEAVLDAIAWYDGTASVLVHNDRLCNAGDDGWTRLYRWLLRRVRTEHGEVVTAAAAASAYLALLPAHRRS